MRATIATTVLCFFLLITGITALGTTIRVPVDQPSIQAGIDAAQSGDTVLVSDGTYYEHISFEGKAIMVASKYIIDADTTHIRQAIIDGSGAPIADTGSVVRFVNGEDSNSVIIGFTIQHGHGTTGMYTGASSGGGFFVVSSSPRVENCQIVGNAAAYGGGIYVEGIAQPTVRYCRIESDTASINGGGIASELSGSMNGTHLTFMKNVSQRASSNAVWAHQLRYYLTCDSCVIDSGQNMYSGYGGVSGVLTIAASEITSANISMGNGVINIIASEVADSRIGPSAAEREEWHRLALADQKEIASGATEISQCHLLNSHVYLYEQYGLLEDSYLEGS
ncbi:MAG: hypothetical protein D6706_01515, partial [Chloroflexi bacterium]